MNRSLCFPILTILLAAAFLGHPDTAAASCAFAGGGDPIANAPLAFVGSVVSTDDGGRRALVRVESIWRGPALPAQVEVIGSPASGSAATSVDRTYRAGQRYLFVPVPGVPIKPPFMDNACSATQPLTPALAAQSPADARPPELGGVDGPSGTPWSLAALVAVGAVSIGAIAFWVWRRRAPRPA